VTNQQVAAAVERKSVGTTGAAVQMREYPDLRCQAAGRQRHAPNLVGARHCDEQKALLGVDDDAVRARNRVEQACEPPIRRELPDPAGGIMHPGLALIGEIEIA
jgi:hypothetical protein